MQRLHPRSARPDEHRRAVTSGDGTRKRVRPPRRGLVLLGVVCLAFSAVAGRLVHLAGSAQDVPLSSMSEAQAENFARPDIVDRNGRLLATDIALPSLYADASVVLDANEVSEKLARLFADLDAGQLRKTLADKTRRFVWIKRGLPPRIAQQVHDLGLPGLLFRDELKRVYPVARLAGHVLGTVSVDNKGISGIERYIDEAVGVEPVHGTTLSGRAPVQLSIDVSVQHTVEDELADAMQLFSAPAAAGLVLDLTTGEVLASVSLPGIDPSRPEETRQDERRDRIQGGTYELGSIFKAVTIAEAIDEGRRGLASMLDVTQPLEAGGFKISDLHPLGRPMTVSEVFIHSSNVGAGMLALEAGPLRQKAFLGRLGLLSTLKTEAGLVMAPQVPARFERVEQITVSYGHGLAVAPLQFAAAAGALLNGGFRLAPTFLRNRPTEATARERLVSAETSAAINELMRRNVVDPAGTGRRADIPGYRVGGKTGTAEMAVAGGYRKKSVLSSFLGAFPMDRPRYLTLVILFEPQSSAETRGEITASMNAAPTTARIIERIAPLLGVAAEPVLASAQRGGARASGPATRP